MCVGLPYAAQASGVLHLLFLHELGEQSLPPSEQPLLCKAKPLCPPKVQEEIYRDACANQGARKQNKRIEMASSLNYTSIFRLCTLRPKCHTTEYV